MPRLGGAELARMVRDDPVHRDIPIFLITGRSDADGAVRAYRSGADTVIAKPFHFEVLIARIGREIERSRSLGKLLHDNAALDARVVGRAIELGEMRERWLASEAELRRLKQWSARPRARSINSRICGADVLALQRQREIGDHVAGLVAAIVAGRVDRGRVERLLADQLGHRVRELDLAAGARSRPCRGSA